MSNNLGAGIVPRTIHVPGTNRRGINNTNGTLLGGSVVTGDEADITYPAAITDVSYGILRGDTIAGGCGDVAQAGKQLVRVGVAGVTAKGRVMPETGGTGCVVDLAAGGAGLNATVVGVAEISGVSGDIVEVTLAPPGTTFQQ